MRFLFLVVIYLKSLLYPKGITLSLPSVYAIILISAIDMASISMEKAQFFSLLKNSKKRSRQSIQGNRLTTQSLYF
jgi:hypothetical protein